MSDKPLDARGLRHDPAAVEHAAGLLGAGQLLRHLPAEGRARRRRQDAREDLGRQISKSEAIKKYAASRGALFAPVYGEAAQKAVFPAVQANAWLLFSSGKAKVSPDTRRHSEALSDSSCPTPPAVRRRPTRRAAEPGSGPRGELHGARLVRARRRGADRLDHDGPARAAGHQPVHGPGPGAGLLGVGDAPARQLAGVRGWRRGWPRARGACPRPTLRLRGGWRSCSRCARLRGGTARPRLPFWMAAAIFVTPASSCCAGAAACGAGRGVRVTTSPSRSRSASARWRRHLVFERLFLVRLP